MIKVQSGLILTLQPTHSLRSATMIGCYLKLITIALQPTHPLRSATLAAIRYFHDQCPVTTHTPLAECDLLATSLFIYFVLLQPHTPCGVRPGYGVFSHTHNRYNPALLAECDCACIYPLIRGHLHMQKCELFIIYIFYLFFCSISFYILSANLSANNTAFLYSLMVRTYSFSISFTPFGMFLRSTSTT